MYLVNISCVLLAFLGTTVDKWRVSGATQSSSTSENNTSSASSRTSIDIEEESNREQDKRYHHQPPPPQYPDYPPLSPQPIPPLYLRDEYIHRYRDGSYEYRYALPNESVRYERGYKIPYQNTEILVVKGYYSYPLPDGRYLTVFYTGDQFGFHQDSSTFSLHRPQLPRSLSEGFSTDGDFRSYIEATEDTTSTNNQEK